MSILLIATDMVEPLDNTGLYYAKPLDDKKSVVKIKDYLLKRGLHSGLNYAEEISETTANGIASDIINILKN